MFTITYLCAIQNWAISFHGTLAIVCRNLYETELSLLVDPDYMHNHGPDHQPKIYIDQSMRMIVISWLVEVACEYGLHQETLFLSAALLDRFMSLSKVDCTLDTQCSQTHCYFHIARLT